MENRSLVPGREVVFALWLPSREGSLLLAGECIAGKEPLGQVRGRADVGKREILRRIRGG